MLQRIVEIIVKTTWLKLKKICFVYNKKCYQSSKNTRKEYKDLKNKFIDQFSQDFYQQTSQDIVEYKTVNYDINDITEKMNNIVEVLIIDMKSLLFFLLDISAQITLSPFLE